MAFGESLYRWRKAKGLTQQELALAVGVNVSYISNLERDFSATTKSGKPRPSEALCAKFAKVLDQNPNDVRLAAGYAPFGADTDTIPISDGVTIRFQGSKDWTDEQRERAIEAFKMIVAGIRARDKE